MMVISVFTATSGELVRAPSEGMGELSSSLPRARSSQSSAYTTAAEWAGKAQSNK